MSGLVKTLWSRKRPEAAQLISSDCAGIYVRLEMAGEHLKRYDPNKMDMQRVHGGFVKVWQLSNGAYLARMRSYPEHRQ